MGAVFPLSAAHDAPDASARRERTHGHVVPTIEAAVFAASEAARMRDEGDVRRERPAHSRWCFSDRPHAETSRRSPHVFALKRGVMECASSRVRKFRRTRSHYRVGRINWSIFAMQMTGHKTRSVFERYNIVSECDLVETAKKLNTLQPIRPSKVRLKPDTTSEDRDGHNSAQWSPIAVPA